MLFRSRQWLDTNLPAMHDFWKEYMDAREGYVPPPDPAPARCDILSGLYDDLA